ncbi:MAG: Enterococcus phage [Bacteroidota bacterium]|jgi:hypothetical protein
MIFRKIRSGLKVKDERTNIEQWREITGYNGRFQVSNIGNVCIVGLNFDRKLLPVRFDKRDGGGYLTVRLNYGGSTNTKYIHRLVADAFIPNHLNKPFVNHINGNKQDNRTRNLEWVTHSENIKHAYNLKLIPRPTEKRVVDIKKKKVYPSIKEASREVGIPYPTMKGYLNGNRKNKTSLRYLNN